MTNSCRASAASGRQAGGQGGAPGGAAPYVTGRARCLAARGGYVNPVSKGARWCPGASRRSTPSRGYRGDWQTSDALRRENKKPWLFEIRIQKFRKATRHTPPSFRDAPPELGFTRVRHYHYPSRLQPTWMRRPGIHSPCVGGWMLNANTVVMDSGLARRARPGMTSCVDETKRKARARARAFRLLNLSAIRRRA
jgi:hypothetical protein